MKKLHIQKFIEEHSDWENIIQEKPYCISINKDTMFGRNLALLKYNQIESDFKNPIVQECRGLILDIDTKELISVPFYKFFNAGETNAAEIDWKTAWTSEKLDGSICKVVRLGDDLIISTNGVIDSYKAPIQPIYLADAGELDTFGKLFEVAVKNAMIKNGYDSSVSYMEWFKDLLDEGYTYIFELTSPYNKVVVSWKTTEIHFIGCRNNQTLEECRFFEHKLSKVFHTPEIFLLGNLSECVEAAEKLDSNHEGFVVCDANFNRIKVKSTLYCGLHHMKNNGVMSFSSGIDVVRNGELDEVLSYFPEFADHLKKIKSDIDNLCIVIKDAWNRYQEIDSSLETRKDKAVKITSTEYFGRYAGVGFALLDGKINSIDEWIKNIENVKLMKLLDYK